MMESVQSWNDAILEQPMSSTVQEAHRDNGLSWFAGLMILAKVNVTRRHGRGYAVI